VDWPAFLTPTLGATGLVALGVLMIMWGKLVPSSTLDRIVREKDSQIDLWKTAYERSEKAHELKDAQIAALMETGRATTSVLQAVHQAAGLDSGRGRNALATPEE
jgi:hypothetical protein